VMFGGRIVGIVDRDRASLEQVGMWMAGALAGATAAEASQ
jgi:hypothetical protein